MPSSKHLNSLPSCLSSFDGSGLATLTKEMPASASILCSILHNVVAKTKYQNSWHSITFYSCGGWLTFRNMRKWAEFFGWRNNHIYHIVFFLFVFFKRRLSASPFYFDSRPLIDFCRQASSHSRLGPVRQVIHRIRQLTDKRSIVAKCYHKGVGLDLPPSHLNPPLTASLQIHSLAFTSQPHLEGN